MLNSKGVIVIYDKIRMLIISPTEMLTEGIKEALVNKIIAKKI